MVANLFEFYCVVCDPEKQVKVKMCDGSWLPLRDAKILLAPRCLAPNRFYIGDHQTCFLLGKTLLKAINENFEINKKILNCVLTDTIL